jgi:hypothetical protein
LLSARRRSSTNGPHCAQHGKIPRALPAASEEIPPSQAAQNLSEHVGLPKLLYGFIDSVSLPAPERENRTEALEWFRKIKKSQAWIS